MFSNINWSFVGRKFSKKKKNLSLTTYIDLNSILLQIKFDDNYNLSSYNINKCSLICWIIIWSIELI